MCYDGGMEDSFLKADIFFIITSVAVLVLSVGFGVILYYTIQILKDLKAISEKARFESDKILEDVRAFREKTEEKGALIAKIVGTALSFNRHRAQKKEESEGNSKVKSKEKKTPKIQK